MSGEGGNAKSDRCVPPTPSDRIQQPLIIFDLRSPTEFKVDINESFGASKSVEERGRRLRNFTLKLRLVQNVQSGGRDLPETQWLKRNLIWARDSFLNYSTKAGVIFTTSNTLFTLTPDFHLYFQI